MLNKEVCKRCIDIWARSCDKYKSEGWGPLDEQTYKIGEIYCPNGNKSDGPVVAEVNGDVPKWCVYELEHVVSI